jgi:uncharacterized protein (DUF983 family)
MARTSVRTAIRRGWSKRCPHCGRGALFAGWGRHLPACDYCGLVYERNSGDTWAFTIIGDRIPIAALVAIIYFGVARRHFALGIAVILAACVVIIWTAPRRWGVGIALHYLSRVYFPDVNDPVPGDNGQ